MNTTSISILITNLHLGIFSSKAEYFTAIINYHTKRSGNESYSIEMHVIIRERWIRRIIYLREACTIPRNWSQYLTAKMVLIIMRMLFFQELRIANWLR